MGEEEAFIRAVVGSPSDGLTRLVYADWLNERSDLRSEYLRLLCAAAGWVGEVGDREGVVARLQELRTESLFQKNAGRSVSGWHASPTRVT